MALLSDLSSSTVGARMFSWNSGDPGHGFQCAKLPIVVICSEVSHYGVAAEVSISLYCNGFVELDTHA